MYIYNLDNYPFNFFNILFETKMSFMLSLFHIEVYFKSGFLCISLKIFSLELKCSFLITFLFVLKKN